jgi:antitoxin Phd
MKVDTNNIVSLSEANRNFSRVARLADDSGAVVILRNNAPSYLLMTFSKAESEQTEPGEDMMAVAHRLTEKGKKAISQGDEATKGGGGA